ncbi:MAG: molybdenum cofactor guanylyltransferase [Caulobacterales bacterium]
MGAIILTGGASSRMGADKASQVWGARRAVDHVAALAEAVGARRIVTAGAAGFGLAHVADAEPPGGPVGGILGGLAFFAGTVGRVLVLAVDAPTIRPSDLQPLLAAEDPGASFLGLPLPMVMSVRSVPGDASPDWPVKRFVERAGLALLAPPPEALLRLRGANTPAERARLAREAGVSGPSAS